jgi:hypothetical protein
MLAVYEKDVALSFTMKLQIKLALNLSTTCLEGTATTLPPIS